MSMKVRILIVSTFLMSIVVFYSCNENLTIKKTDLDKTPWIIPFISGNIKEFEGTHDIDRGVLEFSFEEFPQIGTLLKYDKIASNEDWKVVAVSQLKREYSKANSVGYYEKDKNVIKIYLDTVNSRIHFLVD